MNVETESVKRVLRTLGWTDDDHLELSAGALAGRVSIVHGANAEVIWCGANGDESTALCSFATGLDPRPVAGDWVALREEHIEIVALRRTALRRPGANPGEVQVLAANVDVVLLVVPIDRKINLRMLERLSIMAWDSGAPPVVVLTKADDAMNEMSALAETERALPGVAVFTTSSLSGRGIEALRELLHEGVTAVMLGASGAGKTSLLNALEGTVEFTRSVSRSGEGRHATTTRKLYRLSSGGVLLDIPGIRLLDLMVGQEGLNETFADVARLAEGCRFRDCRHSGDEGCAVEPAVASGELTSRRLASWRAAQFEISNQERRRDSGAPSPARRRASPPGEDSRRR
jgi:ribosome biogenesis GTPase